MGSERNMNILVTGGQNVVKDSVVKLALERLGGHVKFKVLSFSDFVLGSEDSINELHLLKNTQQKLMRNIQLKMLETGAREHVIINGYCTARTKLGYMPIITKASIDIFKPDIIVHVEVDPAALGGKLKDRDDFVQHQSLEKSCALFFGAWAGSVIKIIQTGIEGPRQGADELYELLRDVLVVK